MRKSSCHMILAEGASLLHSTLACLLALFCVCHLFHPFSFASSCSNMVKFGQEEVIPVIFSPDSSKSLHGRKESVSSNDSRTSGESSWDEHLPKRKTAKAKLPVIASKLLFFFCSLLISAIVSNSSISYVKAAA